MAVTRRQAIKVLGGAALAVASPQMATAADPNFAIAFVPDIQFNADAPYQSSAADPTPSKRLYNKIIQHIVNVGPSVNLKGIWCAGDCVDGAGLWSSPQGVQEAVSAAAWSIAFNGGIPVVSPPGNHDYNFLFNTRTVGYNFGNPAGIWHPTNQAARFPIDLGSGDSAIWGGSHQTAGWQEFTTYQLWNIGSWRLCIIAVPFFASSDTWNYVVSVMQAHPTHTCIIVTHAWVSCVGGLAPWNGSTCVSDYFSTISGATTSGNSPQQLMGLDVNAAVGIPQLLSHQPNYGMGIGGHFTSNGSGVSNYYYQRTPVTSSSLRGHMTQNLFCNCQTIDQVNNAGDPPNGNTDAGFICWLYFSPSAGTVTAQLQSVNSGRYIKPATSPGFSSSIVNIDTFPFAPFSDHRRVFRRPTAPDRL
jgi:hypothetical protein